MEDQYLPLNMDAESSSSDIDMDEVDGHSMEPSETYNTYAALSNTTQEQIIHAGGDSFIRMRILMDVDPPEDNVEQSFAETSPLRARQETVKPKIRGSYRRYTPHQIEKLFDLVIEEGKTAKEAALITGINVRTAQNYIKVYNILKLSVHCCVIFTTGSFLSRINTHGNDHNPADDRRIGRKPIQTIVLYE